jgi:hypothetical protein
MGTLTNRNPTPRSGAWERRHLAGHGAKRRFLTLTTWPRLARPPRPLAAAGLVGTLSPLARPNRTGVRHRTPVGIQPA